MTFYKRTRLTKLSLESPASAVFLEAQLLPLLSHSFSRLTSLEIAWESTSIPDLALEFIGSLTTLQQIHLSAGNQFGWRRDWQIDHKAMQKHFRTLTSLKRVAFSRDSYKTEFSSHSIEYYYVDRFFAEVNPQDPKERDRMWEQIHRTRMLTEANAYVQIMPQLEWIYIGQIPMGFKKHSGTHEKVAVALYSEMDDCWTFLREMFGVKD